MSVKMPVAPAGMEFRVGVGEGYYQDYMGGGYFTFGVSLGYSDKKARRKNLIRRSDKLDPTVPSLIAKAAEDMLRAHNNEVARIAAIAAVSGVYPPREVIDG